MLISVVIIIIIKKEIKNSEGKGVIYMILITGKYKILPELRELRGICLIILSFA